MQAASRSWVAPRRGNVPRGIRRRRLGAIVAAARRQIGMELLDRTHELHQDIHQQRIAGLLIKLELRRAAARLDRREALVDERADLQHQRANLGRYSFVADHGRSRMRRTRPLTMGTPRERCCRPGWYTSTQPRHN
jgi:hypothetical protein